MATGVSSPPSSLRKAGKTVLVFWIRGASTVIYLAVSVGLLLVWQTTAAIFLAFVVAEAITVLLYHYAAVRGAPEYAATFGTARRRQESGS
jgi:hypothetical protein